MFSNLAVTTPFFVLTSNGALWTAKSFYCCAYGQAIHELKPYSLNL